MSKKEHGVLTFGEMRDISDSVQRNYSAASVYTNQPALPVLMWSCAKAELSRKKQTSMTSDEKKGPGWSREELLLSPISLFKTEKIPPSHLVFIH